MTRRIADRACGIHLPRSLRGQPRASLLFGVGLILLDACDEGTAQKMLQASQAVEHAGQATPPPAAIEGPIVAYDQCYRECYTAHTNTTHRETCKLECDSLAEDDLKAPADPAARREYQHLRGCFTDCWDRHGLSETNRETCLLTCDDDATIALTPVPKRQLEVVPGTVLTPESAPTPPQ
jgi:hypothetical protein